MYQHFLHASNKFLLQNRGYNHPCNQDNINQFHGHPYHYTTSNIMNVDMNRRRCASASGHLNLYVQAKTTIHNGKFMSKMKQIREKYVGCIDKQQCVLKSYQKQKKNQQQQNLSNAEHKLKQQVKQINHALQQNLNYPLNTEQKQKIFRRSGYTFQSPYNKLDHAEDTSPNTMRKNSPTKSHSSLHQRTANISSSTTARKKPNKKELLNKNTNCNQVPLKLQQKCYQKIKLRVLSSQITHLKLDKISANKWVNKMESLHQKQIKLRQEIKAKILLKLNILPNSQT